MQQIFQIKTYTYKLRITNAIEGPELDSVDFEEVFGMFKQTNWLLIFIL